MTFALRLAAAAFVIGSAPAFADKVGLKNGNVLNGRIVKGAPAPFTPIEQEGKAIAPATEGDPSQGHVAIDLDLGGRMTVPADEIAWVEDVEDPPEAYEPPRPETKKKTAAAPRKPPPAAKKPPPKKGG